MDDKLVNDNVLLLLKQAFYFSLNSVNDAIAQHGVTTAQIGLLRQLANEPGLSGAELARRLLITPQGVQLALTALERSGLVERKQDPQHGRIRQAYLTDQGRAVASAVVADAIAAHEQVFGVLTARGTADAARSTASRRRARYRPQGGRRTRRALGDLRTQCGSTPETPGCAAAMRSVRRRPARAERSVPPDR